MTHEIWQKIFIVSGILSVIFAALTVFLIIHFRFFSLVRFTISSTKTTKKYPADIPEKTTHTEKLSSPVPAPDQSGGTVVAPPHSSESTGTVIASDTFRYIKSIVITNADISQITSLCPRKIAGDSEGAGDQRECRARPQSPAKKQISQTTP